MRLPIFSLATICAAVLLSGCDKQSSAPEPPKSEPKPAASASAAPASAVDAVMADAGKLLQSIGSADAEERSRAGKAAQAIRAESYAAAQEILEHLLAEGHLTPEQKEVVTSTIAHLKRVPAKKP